MAPRRSSRVKGIDKVVTFFVPLESSPIPSPEPPVETAMNNPGSSSIISPTPLDIVPPKMKNKKERKQEKPTKTLATPSPSPPSPPVTESPVVDGAETFVGKQDKGSCKDFGGPSTSKKKEKKEKKKLKKSKPVRPSSPPPSPTPEPDSSLPAYLSSHLITNPSEVVLSVLIDDNGGWFVDEERKLKWLLRFNQTIVSNVPLVSSSILASSEVDCFRNYFSIDYGTLLTPPNVVFPRLVRLFYSNLSQSVNNNLLCLNSIIK